MSCYNLLLFCISKAARVEESLPLIRLAGTMKKHLSYIYIYTHTHWCTPANINHHQVILFILLCIYGTSIIWIENVDWDNNLAESHSSLESFYDIAMNLVALFGSLVTRSLECFCWAKVGTSRYWDGEDWRIHAWICRCPWRVVVFGKRRIICLNSQCDVSWSRNLTTWCFFARIGCLSVCNLFGAWMESQRESRWHFRNQESPYDFQ